MSINLLIEWKNVVYLYNLSQSEGSMKQQESQMQCAKWKRFSRENTRVEYHPPSPEDHHSLLQMIFPTQRTEPRSLPYCRLILYCLSQQGSSSERCQTVKLYTVWLLWKNQNYQGRIEINSCQRLRVGKGDWKIRRNVLVWYPTSIFLFW